MTIDAKHVQNLARLAKLQINEPELNKLEKDLNNILSYVDSLRAVDTSQIQDITTSHLGSPEQARCRLRDDRVTETNQAQDLQSIAPQSGANHYLVPKVIES